MKFNTETQLYLPVKVLLEGCGYEVKSEIKNIDIVGIKNEKMLAVELKLRLNMDVLLQAAERQKTADVVYIAVPVQGRSRRVEKIKYVLKRLQIGLIYVGFDSTAKVIFDAVPFDLQSCRKRYKKCREQIEKEFSERLGDQNTGGSVGKTIMTEYRQNALKIVGILNDLGQGTAAEIKKIGKIENTYSIIYDNYYGWFEKIDRGVYSLSDSGKTAYAENADLIDQLLSLN